MTAVGVEVGVELRRAPLRDQIRILCGDLVQINGAVAGINVEPAFELVAFPDGIRGHIYRIIGVADNVVDRGGRAVIIRFAAGRIKGHGVLLRIPLRDIGLVRAGHRGGHLVVVQRGGIAVEDVAVSRGIIGRRAVGDIRIRVIRDRDLFRAVGIFAAVGVEGQRMLLRSPLRGDHGDMCGLVRNHRFLTCGHGRGRFLIPAGEDPAFSDGIAGHCDVGAELGSRGNSAVRVSLEAVGNRFEFAAVGVIDQRAIVDLEHGVEIHIFSFLNTGLGIPHQEGVAFLGRVLIRQLDVAVDDVLGHVVLFIIHHEERLVGRRILGRLQGHILCGHAEGEGHRGVVRGVDPGILFVAFRHEGAVDLILEVEFALIDLLAVGIQPGQRILNRAVDRGEFLIAGHLIGQVLIPADEVIAFAHGRFRFFRRIIVLILIGQKGFAVGFELAFACVKDVGVGRKLLNGVEVEVLGGHRHGRGVDDRALVTFGQRPALELIAFADRVAVVALEFGQRRAVEDPLIAVDLCTVAVGVMIVEGIGASCEIQHGVRGHALAHNGGGDVGLGLVKHKALGRRRGDGIGAEADVFDRLNIRLRRIVAVRIHIVALDQVGVLTVVGGLPLRVEGLILIVIEEIRLLGRGQNLAVRLKGPAEEGAVLFAGNARIDAGDLLADHAGEGLGRRAVSADKRAAVGIEHHVAEHADHSGVRGGVDIPPITGNLQARCRMLHARLIGTLGEAVNTAAGIRAGGDRKLLGHIGNAFLPGGLDVVVIQHLDLIEAEQPFAVGQHLVAGAGRLHQRAADEAVLIRFILRDLFHPEAAADRTAGLRPPGRLIIFDLKRIAHIRGIERGDIADGIAGRMIIQRKIALIKRKADIDQTGVIIGRCIEIHLQLLTGLCAGRFNPLAALGILAEKLERQSQTVAVIIGIVKFRRGRHRNGAEQKRDREQNRQ